MFEGLFQTTKTQTKTQTGNQFEGIFGTPAPPTPAPLTPNVVPNITPLDVAKQVPTTLKNIATSKPLRVIGKELMKPVSLVAGVAEAIGKTIGEKSVQPLKELPKQELNILTGKTQRSFSDLWRENLPDHPLAGTIIGTLVDIVADPLNFSGGLITKGVNLVGKAVSKIPKVEVALDATKSLFSTATKNKEFDAVINHYQNLGDYRRAEVLTQARNIQKEISTLKPDEVIQVSNYIEKPTIKVSPEIKQIGEELKTTYADWKSIEKGLGVKGGEIAQYAPHIKIQENQGITGIARQFSAKLRGASQGRTIQKFVSPSGEELIGKAENLGLKPIITGYKNVKTGKVLENYLPGTTPIIEGYKTTKGKLFQAVQASIDEINTAFGKKFFEENPAIQMAYRGLSHAKAITSQEFFNDVRQFATKIGTESTAPELKGLKFAPDVAKAIDGYYQALKPKEIQMVFRMYDGVLNWWKAQALIAPSYHVRNFVSNLWNIFLAGEKSPIDFIQAGMAQLGKEVKFTDKVGEVWDSKKLIDAARKTGVINEGWYAKDIPTAIEAEITKGSWNPLSKNNVAFRLNRKIGSAIENNARLALFVKEVKEGKLIEQAAMTVKKFLFDYGDLTGFEKNVMKRIFPFYTWTRKNIPIQLENLMTQPGKYAGLEKVIKGVESISMGNAKPADEKYLSDYIRSNTAMKVGYDNKNKTYYYFLLGNWLPSYQMMDFLAQPLDNIMAMITPLIKTPMETLANKSSFFKNTLGDYEVIERYPGDNVNFLGFNMPKKTATILRNIRLLNELDKLNPGKIFGGKKGEPSIFQKAGLPAVKIPLLGNISPSPMKYSGTTPVPSMGAKISGTLFGKLQGYNVAQGREFYQLDTETRITELKTAIKKAARAGDQARVELLNQQLKDFIKQRGK